MIDRFSRATVMVAIAMLVAGLSAGAGGAAAQAVGPDETLAPDGAVVPQLALTRDQENAIYNAVSNERVKPPAAHVPLTIGAPVPPLVNLPDLLVQDLPVPDNLAIEGARVLKYAMLERKIIVVDPVYMRVVAIIHERPQP